MAAIFFLLQPHHVHHNTMFHCSSASVCLACSAIFDMSMSVLLGGWRTIRAAAAVGREDDGGDMEAEEEAVSSRFESSSSSSSSSVDAA